MQPVTLFGFRSLFIGLLFYGIYLLFLKQRAPFQFIRFYLILALVSMGLFPLFAQLGVILLPRITLFSTLPIKMDSLNTLLLKEVTVGAQQGTPPSTLPVFLSVYLLIAGVLLIRIFVSLLSVIRLWLKSDKVKKGGLHIAVTPGYVPVFSIFNWIFMDRSTMQLKDAGLILAHEKLHIQQKHTFDLLLGEILRIILWFNPFLHLIIKEIKANHEFLADCSVAKTPDKRLNYQNLLIQLSTAIDFNIMTHNFSYSLIKRRILMIKKPNRSMHKFQLYGLTLLVMAGVLFACSTQPKKVESPGSAAKMEPVQGTKQLTVTAYVPDSEKVYLVVDTLPKYPGGVDALMKYLATHIKYPVNAKKAGIQGRVFVNFIINRDGSVSNVRILRGLSPECDAEVIRVVQNMPKWVPGKQKGKNVRVSFNLPVKFSLK